MLNMDFSQRIAINTNNLEWQPSPKAGVWRKPLAREDKERGHATSIVKYEPGASFSEHDHPLGEEILVLEGTFSDHSGDYKKGQYFRNPEGFKHAPFSQEGCTILVKLHQFQAVDDQHIQIDTNSQPWLAGQGNLRVMPLHTHNTESTALVYWPANTKFKPHQHWGGEEIYVISGEFIDEQGRYPAGTWIRSPHLSSHNPYVEVDTLIWVKVGHLLGELANPKD
ncbi:cupin domain-containing protein [Paraglaciecola aquimarina]|uniref:Cupin domain-containing protein n=1 Tax=Paraglaciecola algarum TaxID=3050085 RepID=A0ABS9D8X9_9ALTE|nr:cupin domain-containing protein [Paraglaciecola sp. G1-23]MCF2949400.1 cupin domain-containing protein [Paraglaciecola sp. G1-23]